MEDWVKYVRKVYNEYWDEFDAWKASRIGEPPVGIHFLIKDVIHSKEWMYSVVRAHGFTCSFLV